jgi:2-haloacid dehalogenase
MAGIDFEAFDVITFDCYGTFIDWETGILGALRPILAAHAASVDDEALLERFGVHEAALEAGPYLRYRDVLAGVLRRLGDDFGFEPRDDELEAFAASVGEWPAFEDSAPALQRLHEKFKLAPITNCDDDLFATSAPKLGVELDWVITAEQARSYKPSHWNFELAFDRIGLPRERILHVAQSLYHDHVPAKELGLTSVWIDRRTDKEGPGATAPAEASPDLILPDVRSLAELAVG